MVKATMEIITPEVTICLLSITEVGVNNSHIQQHHSIAVDVCN